MKSENKLSLALGGGSAFGFAHAGLLKTLSEKNIKISELSACSMGAIIAGLMAKFDSGDKVFDFVINISKKDIFNFLNFRFDNYSLFSEKKVRKFFSDCIGDMKIGEASFELKIIASDCDKNLVIFDKNVKIVDAIMASAALPGLLPAQNGLYDGGFNTIVPVNVLTQNNFKIASNVYYIPSKKAWWLNFSILKQFIRTRKESSAADFVFEYNFQNGGMLNFFNIKKYAENGYEQSKRILEGEEWKI